MLTLEDAHHFATDWCARWNSHDLDAIMSHYAEDVVLTSPTAARLMKDPSGTVAGKEALRNYFSVGLKVYPDLRFEVLDVTCGVDSIVIYYANQNGARVCEFMAFDSSGKVKRVIAHYRQ